MTISLKLKILFSLLFFLTTLVLISLLGYRYIQIFAEKSRTIMEDNYVSVRYAADMQERLYLIHEFQLRSIFLGKEKENRLFRPNKAYQEALIGFEAQLLAAQKNITELQEEEVIDSIKNNYRAYLAAFRKTYNTSVFQDEVNMLSLSSEQFVPLYNRLKAQITNLQNLNMDAILEKSKTIQETGNSVSFYLSVLALISILFASILLIFLPGYLANPITELNNKIQQIIEENFDQKLELKYHSRDEVGELAASFNAMASKLKHYEESNLSKIWFEKKRMEAVLEILHKAILVLDQNQKFLYINKEAENLIKIPEKKLLGMHISSIAAWNDTVKSIAETLINPENEYLALEGQRSTQWIKLQTEENKEQVYKADISEMHTDEDNPNKKQLLGYVIVLEQLMG